VWTFGKNQTCINVERKNVKNKYIKACSYSNQDYYKKYDYNIISLEEYYTTQKITPEIIKELNEWYNTNKPDRKSKG
jgi:hypothetical protein